MYMRSDLTSTMPNLQQNTSTQTSWDPSTISNVIFGIIMVFVGLVAIWQGRHKRFIALNGWLAIIESPPRSRSPPHSPGFELRSDIPLPAHHTPSGTSTALPSMAQLGIATGGRNLSGNPTRDHIAAVQMVSDRTCTLSLVGRVDQPAQHIQGFTAQLDITEIEGCERCEDAVDEPRTSQEVVDQKEGIVF